MKKILHLTLCILLWACSTKDNKISKSDNVENIQKKASVKQINSSKVNRKSCDELWDEYRVRLNSKDSIINYIISQYPNAPINNKQLLESIVLSKDSSLTIAQPLSSIFEGIDSIPFIPSKERIIKTEENGKVKWLYYNPEKDIISKYDTIVYDLDVSNEESVTAYMNNQTARKYFPEAVENLLPQNRSLFAYSKTAKSTAHINSMGLQNSICDDGYSFYMLESKITNMLFSSPIDIDLEFGNWKKIDSIILNEPRYNCFDCLNSYKEGATFAKLKGYPDIYFVYAGELDNAVELDTPYRSLIYVNKQNEIYNLWHGEIDLFGCGCL